MRTVWLVIGSIVTVVALAFGTYQVVGLVAREEVTERASFPAAGVARVDLRNDNGSMEIVGGDVDEIELVAEISHGLRRTSHRAEVEGDTLVVRGACPSFTTWWCEVDYRLVVPRAIEVVAHMDNGALTITDVDGAVRVDGDNSPIDLVRLTGPIEATTDNGSVEGIALRSPSVTVDSDNGRVDLTFVEPPMSVRATTDNGSVEVVLPEGPEEYRVDVQTDNGRTNVGVRTDPTSDRVVDAETDNGSVTVRYPTG